MTLQSKGPDSAFSSLLNTLHSQVASRLDGSPGVNLLQREHMPQGHSSTTSSGEADHARPSTTDASSGITTDEAAMGHSHAPGDAPPYSNMVDADLFSRTMDEIDNIDWEAFTLAFGLPAQFED
jgi:hypothetical protein